MDFAGGSRFTTSSVLRMEAQDGGCQVCWLRAEPAKELRLAALCCESAC